jgi:hypothetical protein
MPYNKSGLLTYAGFTYMAYAMCLFAIRGCRRRLPQPRGCVRGGQWGQWGQVCITIIDTIINTNYTNDAYYYGAVGLAT